MKNYTIAVDCDDVTAEFVPALIEFHNYTYGTKLKREDFHSFRFNEAWGGTLEEAIEEVKTFNKTEYSKNIMPVQNSQKILKLLKSKGNKLYVLTSRHISMKEETEKFYDKFFKGIFNGIYFSGNSITNYRGKSKAEICSELKADYLIEDMREHAMACDKNPLLKVLLLDAPWNQENGISFPSNVTRFYNWSEVLRLIHGE